MESGSRVNAGGEGEGVHRIAGGNRGSRTGVEEHKRKGRAAALALAAKVSGPVRPAAGLEMHCLK